MATIAKQKKINTAVSIAVLDFAGASAERDRRPVRRKSRNRGAISVILTALAPLPIFDTVDLLRAALAQCRGKNNVMAPAAPLSSPITKIMTISNSIISTEV